MIQTPESFHEIADVVGILLSGPVILAIVRGFMAFGRIETSIESLGEKQVEHTRTVGKVLDDHEGRIRFAERQIAPLIHNSSNQYNPHHDNPLKDSP